MICQGPWFFLLSLIPSTRHAAKGYTKGYRYYTKFLQPFAARRKDRTNGESTFPRAAYGQMSVEKLVDLVEGAGLQLGEGDEVTVDFTDGGEATVTVKGVAHTVHFAS